jgi:hypothetical protein
LPAPLITPLDPEDEWEFQFTSLAPPDPSCGCQPLSNPAGPTITALVEDETDNTGMTVTLTGTTIGARPMQVDWGDGTTPATLTTATPTDHQYTTDGTYVISVRFTDAAQETSFRQVTVPF